MFGIVNLPAFIVAGILLNLTPGADTMYILGRSITQGRKAGIYSALGIVTGFFCHITFAAFWLSLIIAKSALALNLIKYIGAIYLAYLGVKMLMTKSQTAINLDIKQLSLRRLYISGVLTNVLNPKVALFFLVFLPQFVRASEVHNPLPFILLGIIFVLPGTIWCMALATFASMLSRRINKNRKISLWLNRVTGGIFIALGLKLAYLSKN